MAWQQRLWGWVMMRRRTMKMTEGMQDNSR
jgi:hypothetical protein